eukprot:4916594-Amphidinium_carterae.1
MELKAKTVEFWMPVLFSAKGARHELYQRRSYTARYVDPAEDVEYQLTGLDAVCATNALINGGSYVAFGERHPWSGIVGNIKRRVHDALLRVRKFVSATVFSSKLEQKPSARPIYAGDVELRQLLRMFATSATGLAKRCISTAATYEVEQMWTLQDSTLRSTAEGAKTRVSRIISCDISGWSPHFQRARHIKRFFFC